MYKKFYIAKTLINILIVGLIDFYIFFDVLNYVIVLTCLIVVFQIIFKLIVKHKFEEQAFKTKNHAILNIAMVLSLWAGLYFFRPFIVLTWIIYVFIEGFAYKESQEYFE